MKINKILFNIILLTLLIVICNSCICYAENALPDMDDGSIPPEGNSEVPEDSGGSGAVGLPDISKFQIQLDTGDKATSIISIILGALRIVGIIVIVIAIALIGFNTILGSASQKAEGAEKYIGLIIAAALLTGGSWIAEAIISVAESL